MAAASFHTLSSRRFVLVAKRKPYLLLRGDQEARAAGMTHSRSVSRVSASSLMVGLALLLCSCAQGLAFVQDDRLEFTAPEERAKVSLPVTIRWNIEDFRVTGPTGRAEKDAGYFGVFLDEFPVPPGKALSWIARDDRRCRPAAGCPDANYLAKRGVYATSATSITFTQLPDQDAYKGHETHELTVVLLDGAGRRIGESAWHIAFRFDREE